MVMTEDPEDLAEQVLAELQDAQDGGPYDDAACRSAFDTLEALARAVLELSKERDEARAEVERLRASARRKERGSRTLLVTT